MRSARSWAIISQPPCEWGYGSGLLRDGAAPFSCAPANIACPFAELFVPLLRFFFLGLGLGEFFHCVADASHDLEEELLDLNEIEAEFFLHGFRDFGVLKPSLGGLAIGHGAELRELREGVVLKRLCSPEAREEAAPFDHGQSVVVVGDSRRDVAFPSFDKCAPLLAVKQAA